MASLACGTVVPHPAFRIKGLECSAQRYVRRKREKTTKAVLNQSARSGSVKSGRREDHGPHNRSSLPLHGLGLLRCGATGSGDAGGQPPVIFILRLDWRCGGRCGRDHVVDLSRVAILPGCFPVPWMGKNKRLRCKWRVLRRREAGGSQSKSRLRQGLSLFCGCDPDTSCSERSPAPL